MLLPGWWRVPTLSINLDHGERKPLGLRWGQEPAGTVHLQTVVYRPCLFIWLPPSSFLTCYILSLASQVVLVVKNLPAKAEDTGDAGSIPGLGRSLRVGNRNTPPVFLPG